MASRNGFRIGVIGVGVMGERHTRVYSTSSQVAEVGVFDMDTQRARRVASQYDAHIASSVEDIIAWADAVSIVTPTETHLDLALNCMQHGVHVLVEKPLAQSTHQGNMLVRASKEYGCIAQVGHIERFNPTVTQLQLVLKKHTPLAMMIRRMSPFDPRNTDIDVIFDLMIHDLDLVMALFGDEIVGIEAHGLSQRTNCTDHAVATLVFRTGPLVTLVASRITEQKVRHIEVVADDSYIEADLLNKQIRIHHHTIPHYTNDSASVTYRQESLIEQIHVPAVEPLALELDHFLTCVREGSQPLVSAMEGQRALQLAEMVRDLMDVHETTTVIPILPIPVAQGAAKWTA